MKIDLWEGCYPSRWKGLIVPDAITHPAKFSSKLIRRIYEHMIAEGWLKIVALPKLIGRMWFVWSSDMAAGTPLFVE